MGEPVVILCGRLGDLYTTPVEGAKKHPCNRCAHDVWVAPSSFELVASHHAEIVCIECGHGDFKKARKNDKIYATPAQIREIHANAERRKQ